MNPSRARKKQPAPVKSRLLQGEQGKSGGTGKLSQQLDKDLAAKAYRKVMSGEAPTAQEQAALRRYEKEQEETKRWQYYESIPQKHWRQMSGRQTKVLQDQAERYGLPCAGRTIHLPEFVRAIHNFLAANARRLAADGDSLLESGPLSPALERYREERAKLARLDRLARESKLIPRDQVRDLLLKVASIIRQLGETLRRQYGPECQALLNDALDQAESLVREYCGEEALAEISQGSLDEQPSEP